MATTEARKISFQEAWDTTTIFFVDEELEAEIDNEVEALLQVAQDTRVAEGSPVDADSIAAFLQENDLSLDVILRDIELSEEKFMRMISLLRKLGHIQGGLEVGDTEHRSGIRRVGSGNVFLQVVHAVGVPVGRW